MNIRTRRSPGPLLLVLLCFISSAGIRLGSQGVAYASTLSDEIITPKMEPQACEAAAIPEVGTLLASILERQEQLEQREIEIAARRETLDSVEVRVMAQLEKLQAAEAQLASTLAIADSATENDLSRLTQVYEKMKPKDAARIFETMEMSFAAGFLSRMKPEFAAGVLAELPADFAYSVSVVMAGRNARAPTE